MKKDMKEIYTRPEAEIFAVEIRDILLLSNEMPFVPVGMDEQEK